MVTGSTWCCSTRATATDRPPSCSTGPSTTTPGTSRAELRGDRLLDLSERAHRLLTDNPVARLATAGADGVPHAVPVCFAVAGDLVYSVIDEKPKRTQRLRRIRNIEESGHATLIVDRYDDDWGQLGWVMLRAEADILGPGPDGALGDEHQHEHARAIALLRARYHQYLAMDLDRAPLLRLRVQRATEWWATPEGR